MRAPAAACKDLETLQEALKAECIGRSATTAASCDQDASHLINCGEFLAEFATIGVNLDPTHRDYDKVPVEVLQRFDQFEQWEPPEWIEKAAAEPTDKVAAKKGTKKEEATKKSTKKKKKMVYMLWCGFWEGDGSKQELDAWAKEIDGHRLHPESKLGQMAADSNDLLGCKGNQAWGFWSIASTLFARRMATKQTILLMVNKELTGDRPLKDSVMWQFELPAISAMMQNKKTWAPDIWAVDLQGTCQSTQPLVASALYWGQWTSFTCIDCKPPACVLGKELMNQMVNLGFERN